MMNYLFENKSLISQAYDDSLGHDASLLGGVGGYFLAKNKIGAVKHVTMIVYIKQ